MGFNCSRSTCCFCCLYRRCFPAACCFGKNKTSPGGISPSPPPSIALTIASRSQADEESIQDQLTLFHFGGKGSSGRRYSHPNQAPYVEEYERRKSNPGSPAPSLPHDHDLDMDGNGNKVETPTPPQSPIMQYPIIPPGRLM